MRQAFLAAALIVSTAPAFAGEVNTPRERIWRTPDTSHVPADLRERRRMDLQIVVDPRDRGRPQAGPSEGSNGPRRRVDPFVNRVGRP